MKEKCTHKYYIPSGKAPSNATFIFLVVVFLFSCITSLLYGLAMPLLLKTILSDFFRSLLICFGKFNYNLNDD